MAQLYLNTIEIFTREDEAINAELIISYCAELESNHLDKTIHLICDNGRANKNRALKISILKLLK